MNRFFTLLLAASCLTAVGQQQIATCQLPVEINLENIEGSLVYWNDYQINEQTILVEEAGTYTATAADLNRSLNGTVDGFMEVAEIPGYELNAHTLSLWIRPSSTSGVQDLISKDGECGERQWLLTLQNGKYHAHVWLEDHDLVMIVTEEIASTGVWTHLAQVWDGQTLQLFVNGQLADQLPCEGALATGDEPLRICGGASEGCNQYEGDCETDDVTFWDRALSADELSMVYEGQAEVFSDCLSRWTFDGVEDPLEDIGLAGNQDINNSLPFLTELNNFSTTVFEVIEVQCDLLEICGPGTIWDTEMQMCIVSNPSDSNFDGCVQLNDLLDLLSAYGGCEAEASPWLCGDPLEFQGYDYATVQIGEQCWFAENLRTENYRNGDSIPGDLSDDDWETTMEGARAGYNEDPALIVEYGYLYNLHTVVDERGLCPSGWHVPSSNEFDPLASTLGGYDVAGEALKSSAEDTPSWNGTNTSGFKGLPAGYRDMFGSFGMLGVDGHWWTSTPYSCGGRDKKLHTDYQFLNTHHGCLNHGNSVRCIQDAE